MTGAKPNWIGHSLSGRYRIDTLLGQGGMSAVYRAYDPNLRRTVAVKLIHSHLSTDPEFVRRFEQEAGAVAALRHPNIVQVYDFDHDGDTYYMVMEYVEGESLQRRLRVLGQTGQRMSQAEALDLVATVSTAVGFAHQRGLIHRDLKPANIMLSAAGQPILMDFGVVKIVGGQQHTATGVVVGTPMYVAPELIRGRQPDARSDIYSLGVMLFEMLAGRPPFNADSAMALMVKHVNEPVPDIRAIQPDISPAVARIVERALAKDPNERFQSANEFANALRSAHLERAARGAAATGAWGAGGRASGGSSGPVREPAPALAAPAGSRRGLVVLACGGLLALGLLASAAAAVAMMALNPGRAPATPTVTVAPTEANTTAPTSTAPAPTDTRPAASPTGAAAATNTAPAPTNTAPPTRTLAPLWTPTSPPPTWTEPPPPTATPTATAPTTLMARITHISIVNGRYAVSFTTEGYVARLPGQHVHFFFNTVPPQQAGAPAGGPWIVHAAEPNPFTGYAVNDRPSAATAMCILVANPDHSIVLNSGNCLELPT